MALRFTSLTSDPTSMTPEGRKVDLIYQAHAAGGTNPSHMRATFIIDDDDFFFLEDGRRTKQISHPKSGEIAAPSASKEFTRATEIVPRNSTALGRFGVLKINGELQGYDANGDKTNNFGKKKPLPLSKRERSCLIRLDQVALALGVANKNRPMKALGEMDPVTAALRLVSNSMGITNVQFSRVLGVSTDTVARVLRGESSPKLREALERIFKQGK